MLRFSHLCRPLTMPIVLLGGLLLWSSVSFATELPTAVVANDGRFWQVEEGLYMDLFPQGQEVAGWNPVLALSTIHGERHLVPGSEGIAVDSRAALLVDEGQLLVLWTAELLGDRSRFNLVGFDGATFSTPVELSGDPQRLKGPSRVAVTKDSYTVIDGDAAPTTLDRTTLHLVWWEGRTADAGLRVLYTPVILLNGEYVGWNPVIPLDTFDLHEPVSEPLDHQELQRASTIEPSSHRSAVLALPQLASGRMLGLKIDVLPADLAHLADEARSHIVLVGRAAPAGPEGIREIADYARSHIVLVGRAELHRGIRQHIAESVADFILAQDPDAFDPEDVEPLAESAWREALVSGASVLGNPHRKREPTCGILALDPATHAVETAHYLQVCLQSDRPLPATPLDREHQLLISETAEEMIVVWSNPDASLGFRRSTSEGWSEGLRVEVPEGISAQAALRALAQQLRPE